MDEEGGGKDGQRAEPACFCSDCDGRKNTAELTDGTSAENAASLPVLF